MYNEKKAKKFVNVIVHKMLDDFNIKMVNGAPRHSQSQGSVERGNKDIEDLLYTWMSTNKTSRWAEALPSIQLMKNTRYHRALQARLTEAVWTHPTSQLLFKSMIQRQDFTHWGQKLELSTHGSQETNLT